jgi:hypothetical protein
MATYYVACFCERDNLLSQWRAYGRSGGFAVGFTREVELLQAEGMTLSPLQKVLYKREEQVRRVDEMIEEAIGLFRDDDVCRGNADNPSAGDVIQAGHEVAQVLLAAIVCFKAPDFAEEQELRLVCQPYYADKSEKVDAVRKIVRLRASSRGLVPYIELGARDSTAALPIDSVRFGPTQNPDLAQSATRLLLDSKGLQTVRVEGSSIPVIL